MIEKKKKEKTTLEVKNLGTSEIEKFDGSADSNLMNFIDKFEFYADMAEWDNKERLNRLLLCLDGHAFRIARENGLTYVDKEKNGNTVRVKEYTYNLTLNSLISNYCSVGKYRVYYQQLMEAKLREDRGLSLESFHRHISGLCSTLKGLASLGLGQVVQENLKQHVFINGIPQVISKQLKLGNVKGYLNCYNRAIEIASAINYDSHRSKSYKEKSKKNENNSSKSFTGNAEKTYKKSLTVI